MQKAASALSALQSAPQNDGCDLSHILAALDAVVYDWDIAQDSLKFGANVEQALTGLPKAAYASGAAYASCITLDSEASRYQIIFNDCQRDEGAGVPFRIRYKLLCQDNTAMEVEDFGRWFVGAEGRPARVHGIVRVLNRKAEIIAVPYGGFFETILCSRAAFNAFVNKRCCDSHIEDQTWALMMFGITNLNIINMYNGYDVGDEVIAAVRRGLACNLRYEDRITYIVGGKFAAIVALSARDDPLATAKRILHASLAHVEATLTQPLHLDVRVGISLWGHHAHNAHVLVQHADEAYTSCATGADPVRLYSQILSSIQRPKVDILRREDLVAALNQGRIFLAYQPIVSTRSQGVDFEEALMRLRKPDGHVLGADAFVPMAEKNGLIALLDERVLTLAFARLAAETECRLSINVSLVTLQSPWLYDRLREYFATTPSAASRFTLEILETQLIESPTAIAEMIARIKKLGCRVAMDDFGAGYTSFKNLRNLGVDMVKIDGAFVQSLAFSVEDRFFVRTLCELAKRLGLQTVAEWVEDAESARLLRAWGVDYLQGHFIGSPTIEPKSAGHLGMSA